jgi:hypothetical protein
MDEKEILGTLALTQKYLHFNTVCLWGSYSQTMQWFFFSE